MAKKKPSDGRLPGMESSAIQPIEEAADSYEQARDERMALTTDEVAAKQGLIHQMHKHDKTVYRRELTDGTILDIQLTVEKESVKLRRRKPKAGNQDET
jgi:hypothetical protein